VSERRGDKARFAKQRQSKILRRKRLREAWKTMNLEGKTRNNSGRNQVSVKSRGGFQ
jgi:hypothetical protein